MGGPAVGGISAPVCQAGDSCDFVEFLDRPYRCPLAPGYQSTNRDPSETEFVDPTIADAVEVFARLKIGGVRSVSCTVPGRYILPDCETIAYSLGGLQFVKELGGLDEYDVVVDSSGRIVLKQRSGGREWKIPGEPEILEAWTLAYAGSTSLSALRLLVAKGMGSLVNLSAKVRAVCERLSADLMLYQAVFDVPVPEKEPELPAEKGQVEGRMYERVIRLIE